MTWAEENARPFLPFKKERKKQPRELIISLKTKKALGDLDTVDTVAQFEVLEHSSRERWR